MIIFVVVVVIIESVSSMGGLANCFRRKVDKLCESKCHPNETQMGAFG